MKDVTPAQALIMWCLLGKHGQALQSEILPEVKPKNRKPLEGLGLISCEKRQRGALFLKVEDKGWRWASEHLRNELPRSYQVLQHWLSLIQHSIEKNEGTLAEFIGSAPELPIASVIPQKKRGPSPKAPKKQKVPSEKTSKTTGKKAKSPSQKKLRELIEKAYFAETDGQAAVRVLLSAIRYRLAEIDRSTLDKALTKLHESDKHISLMRLDNPREITEREKHAQVMFKGEPLHLLWIKR